MAIKTKVKTATKKVLKTDEGVLRQSLLIGLGLVDLTREKVEKYLADLKKDLPAQARKRAADDFIKSIKSNSKNIEFSTRKHLKEALDQMSAKIDPAQKSK